MNHGYIRVSTDKQELSIDAQKERLEAYAKFAGMELSEVFVDEDVSGSIPLAERPAGASMNVMASKGDTIIAVKIDRCFRDTADGISTLFNWHERGITVHLADSSTIASTATPSGFLTIAMQLVIAQYERMVIGERTAHALDHKRKKGEIITRPDRIPYGYKHGPVYNTLVPCKEERALMSLADDHRLSGESYATVAELLHDSGFRLLRGREINRHTARNLVLAHRALEPEASASDCTDVL